MRFKQISLFLIPAALGLVAAGCSTSSAVEPKRAAAAAPAAPSADSVSVSDEQLRQFKFESPVQRDVSASREATGKVAYNEDTSTPVFSPYAGRIVRLLVKPGDTVRQGAPLLEVDTPELAAAESDLLTGQALLAKAQATLRQSERTRDRLQRLVAGEAAPAKDLEQASTEAANAANDMHAAQATVSAAEQRLATFGKTPDEIQKLTTTHQVDRIARIFSPIGGTVVARNAGPGQYVRPDAGDPIYTLADLSSLWLLADVYESDADGVRLNQPVSVSVLALQNQHFNARVSYIAPAVDPETRRVSVRCVVANPHGLLKPEMFASFHIDSVKAGVLTVSQKAVIRENGQFIIWVLRDGHELVRRVVETGVQQDGWVEVRTGLKAGDRVVADGALFVSNARNS